MTTLLKISSPATDTQSATTLKRNINMLDSEDPPFPDTVFLKNLQLLFSGHFCFAQGDCVLQAPQDLSTKWVQLSISASEQCCPPSIRDLSNQKRSQSVSLSRAWQMLQKPGKSLPMEVLPQCTCKHNVVPAFTANFRIAGYLIN